MTEEMLRLLEETARIAGYGEPKGIAAIVGGLIAIFLSLLGIIFLCLVIYGGFIWMTSGGNEQKILKAKKTLTDSTIGLIIILSSYAITSFVIRSLAEATI